MKLERTRFHQISFGVQLGILPPLPSALPQPVPDRPQFLKGAPKIVWWGPSVGKKKKTVHKPFLNRL